MPELLTPGRWLWALLALTVVCGSSETVAQVITGSALYRERIALPPDAVFETTLEEVSRADAPADVLGRTRLEPAGQSPFQFEIGYDPARIKASRRYAVRARVTQADRLLFTTDRVYPVLTRGHGNTVELLLRRASDKVPSPKVATPPLGVLPASFAGELPCADCPGVRWQLDLFPDRSFQLRMTYRDKPQDQIQDDIGRWSLNDKSKVLRLTGSREAAISFELRGTDTLRKLDLEGRPIESRLNYELKRLASFAPIEPRLAFTGLYAYLADSGLLAVCATGQRLPVATEGDNAALEAAYSAARRRPGEPLLVSLEGRIVQRPPMKGTAGPRPTVVVERFIAIWPGATCRSNLTAANLQDTYWKLTHLNGVPVTVGNRQREPHIVLHTEPRQLAGFGGCNRLAGGYQLDGAKLSFGEIAATMMACSAGMDQEQKFTAALKRVTGWRISGQRLELLDAAGQPVARFEAVALRR
jgi:copper homeostasis protein (lipoprotein)